MTDEQEAAFQSEYRTAITRAETDEDMARRMFEAGICFAQNEFMKSIEKAFKAMPL